MNLFKYHNISEGFDFQGIADEFNNKQDKLEKNNGLDTDLDKNDIDLNFTNKQEINDFILNFLKKHKLFHKRNKKFPVMGTDPNKINPNKEIGSYLYEINFNKSIEFFIYTNVFKELDLYTNEIRTFFGYSKISLSNTSIFFKCVSFYKNDEDYIKNMFKFKKWNVHFPILYYYKNIDLSNNLFTALFFKNIKDCTLKELDDILKEIEKLIIKNKKYKDNNINEGFDFQSIADNYNEYQDSLEKNNGLDTDLTKNNNIDISFSSNKDIIKYACDYAKKHDGKSVSSGFLCRRFPFLEYLKFYTGKYPYFLTTLDTFKKIYRNYNDKEGFFAPSEFVIFINEEPKYSRFIFKFIDETFKKILDKIFTPDKFRSYEEDYYNSNLMIITYYYDDNISKISVSDLDKILNAVYKQKALKINQYLSRNKKVDEGFDFQSMADEFNNKQDEFEKNNGLDTDLDKNNLLNSVDLTNKDYFDIIKDFLKRNKPFSLVKDFIKGYNLMFDNLNIKNSNSDDLLKFKKNIGKYTYNPDPGFLVFYIIFDIFKYKSRYAHQFTYSNIYITITMDVITFEFNFCHSYFKNILINIFKGWDLNMNMNHYNLDDNVISLCFSHSQKDLNIDNLIDILKNIKNIVLQNKNKDKDNYLNYNVSEGFDFQGIADEFNNKQDELENNNGLDTDLDKNNIDIKIENSYEIVNLMKSFFKKYPDKFFDMSGEFPIMNHKAGVIQININRYSEYVISIMLKNKILVSIITKGDNSDKIMFDMNVSMITEDNPIVGELKKLAAEIDFDYYDKSQLKYDYYKAVHPRLFKNGEITLSEIEKILNFIYINI